MAFLKSPPNSAEPVAGRREKLLERFSNWDGPAVEVISATEERAINRLEIADGFVPKWTDGRVALLSDACHALSPNLGQGACLTIEDAVTLAKLLAGAHDVPAALAEYERRRKPRTRSVFTRAHLLGSVRNWDSAVMCSMRDLMVRTWIKYPETWFHWRDVSHRV